MKEKNPDAVRLGKRGGASKSAKKRRASLANLEKALAAKKRKKAQL